MGNRIKSEDEIEKDFIKQLQKHGYSKIILHDVKDLEHNFKKQLEVLNSTTFSEEELRFIKLSINKNSVFENSKVIRDRVILKRDDGPKYVHFYDKENTNNTAFISPCVNFGAP